MSKFIQISKRIGWRGHCAIPSVEVAQELHKEVTTNNCENSFELVFKIHRFAPSPENKEEINAMQFIYKAYNIGREYFSLQS